MSVPESVSAFLMVSGLTGTCPKSEAEKMSGMKIVTNDLCALKCKLNAIFAYCFCIRDMPATKLIKIHKAVMRQCTKIKGLRDILISLFILAAITMPQK